MHDPWLTVWPTPGNRRQVTIATVEPVEYQELYRVAFQDSAGKQLGVQLHSMELRTLIEKGAELLGLSLVP